MSGSGQPSSSLSGRDLLATVALCFALFFLLGPLLVGSGAVGLAIAQILSFAIPALLVSYTRTGGIAMVGLRRFPKWALASAVLLALSLWIWNVHWVAPIGADWSNTDQESALTELFALSSRPLWESLFFFAVVPAFCEELLHRGVILPGLCKRLGPRVGLLVSALFFGLSHFNLARLLPTALLGLVAGGVRLRTGSLWPAIALHFLYNASLLTAAQQEWFPAPWLAWPAAAVTLAGAAWLVRVTRSHTDLDS